ncbi:hypothetical protein Kpol_1048p58 [Vanderwaltozyma polyspora DSM 70294]|uniref:Phosphatidylinositol N-acetylglucosaminyltransferase n=1 Tax=Vanderwaltozyma polyspora (strain ATCC 22028 / DSM 70294 / BCRC 21397 / CBS 2163 / NBRC 10782 / NRRL Y-8283 / UCD 57-17) TaxID=436907 RepID=A7TGM0_VANPO|nr:uncharacterized protein Kpol_1048p58 [Vanderwaltozyma polyspora DSM 70294]EDO18627.1 hypothetical protein Kpol_1048p58 [Vanderwaltozyma polyspora DSM 70294]
MEKKPWKRLLWLKQDYPDNYTDPNFIKKAETFHKRLNFLNSPYKHESNYFKVRYEFFQFYQSILNVSSIFLIFAYIYYYKQDPLPLTIVVTVVVSCLLMSKKHDNPLFVRLLNLKSVIIITFAMLTLTPVLKSLSKTTASDSIWTLSFWLTLMYISALSNTKDKKSSNVSTNLLLAVVTALASRLSSTTEVFCFLYICIQVNVLLPNLIVPSYLLALISNIIVYAVITQILGWHYTILILSTFLLYIIVLPHWFIYWQINYRMLEDGDGRDEKDCLITSWDAKRPVLNC